MLNVQCSMNKPLLIRRSAFCLSGTVRAQEFSEEDNFSAEIGYVNKQFVTDFGNGEVFHENLFGLEDKFLHGFQLGIFYHPTFRLGEHFGVGCRTGLAYEQYLASGRPIISGEGDRYSLINQYHCGISKDYQNTQELVDAIDEMKNHPVPPEHIRSVAERFDYKVLTDQLLAVIEKCRAQFPGQKEA